MSTGRNEPCPCGSGKKFKRCCLLQGDPAQKKRQRIIGISLGVVLALAIIAGVAISGDVALGVGAAGVILVGVWMWFTAPPPNAGSGSDPSAINFGR